jgi:hypothetical protein
MDEMKPEAEPTPSSVQKSSLSMPSAVPFSEVVSESAVVGERLPVQD